MTLSKKLRKLLNLIQPDDEQPLVANGCLVPGSNPELENEIKKLTDKINEARERMATPKIMKSK